MIMFWLAKSKMGVTPIEYIILAHLRYRELLNDEQIGQYGNEMIKDLNDLFKGIWEAQSGTIYPILSKLDSQKNLIIGENKKSDLGPVKKVYLLTIEGRNLIDNVIRENFKQDEEFIKRYSELIEPFKRMFEEEISKKNHTSSTENAENEENNDESRKCPKCNEELAKGAKFCANCGYFLKSFGSDYI